MTLESEIMIVFITVIFGSGTLFGWHLRDRQSEKERKEEPLGYYQPPQATHIPQSNLEALLRKPVITVRHKQIKSVPKKPKPLLERAGVLHVPIPNGKTESYF